MVPRARWAACCPSRPAAILPRPARASPNVAPEANGPYINAVLYCCSDRSLPNRALTELISAAVSRRIDIHLFVPSSPRRSPHSSARPAPAAARPNISIPTAAVCLGAQPWTALPEVALPEAVAVAALPVAVADEAEPVAEAPDAVEQLTTVGTVTPWAEQIWVAKTMTLDWSAWSQALLTQQAMLERKALLEQMHLGSVPQPA